MMVDSSGSGNEVPLELLHSELVSYVMKLEDKESNFEQENVSTLELFGFTAGFRLIENLTKELPPFKDELDTVKFMCTDFWPSIYMKPIDNLRTNHQGIYVLQDNDFRFLRRISASSQYFEFAPYYVAFTTGLLRGALANLGINCVVIATVQSMPTCKFHVQVQKNDRTCNNH